MTSDISFSGLASGIDTDSLIAKLVEAESTYKTQLSDWRDEWQNKVDELDTLSTKLTSLQSTMTVLKSESTFFSRTGSSSDSTVASVAVDSTAQPAAYSIQVGSNTRNILESRGYTSASDTVMTSGGTAQSMVIAVGSESYTVDNSTDKTLQDICDEINTNMTGVDAEVIDDGTSSNAYRLKLTAVNGGSANKINITSSNVDLMSNGVDDVEAISASGSASITSNAGAGSYTGSVNKRFKLEVTQAGTIGSGTMKLTWTDTVEGKSGTLTVSSAGTYDLTQGVKLTFADGATYVKGATYGLDVYTSTVQQAQDTGLAQAEKEVHAGFCDADTTALTTSDATFSYSYAGNKVADISVPSGTTLQGLADLINNDADNPGVKATVLNDGSGTTSSYHLVLTSTSTGAANTISDIDISSFTNTQFNKGTGTEFTEAQSAANAMVRQDGYPNGATWLQFDSNLVTDLVDGASITLKGVGTTNVSVANDSDAMTQKVQDFVDAYNDVMDYINTLTQVVQDDDGSIDEDNTGDLVGNYGLLTVQSELELFIATSGTGYEDGTDAFTLLSQMGLTTGDDKMLEFDTETFASALADNADALVNFFSDDNAGITDSSNVSYYGSTGLTQAGKYHYKIAVDASGKATSAVYWLDGQTEADAINLIIDSSGKYVTATTGDAKGMALQISGATSTTLEGEVRVKQGKAYAFDDLMEKLNDDDSGTVQVLVNNYENIISNIDDRIDYETDRIDLVEERLKERYANLETSIQTYNSTLSSLQSEISQIPSLG